MADRFLTDEEKKMIEDHALGDYSGSVQARLRAAEAVCRATQIINRCWTDGIAVNVEMTTALDEALAAWEATCKS